LVGKSGSQGDVGEGSVRAGELLTGELDLQTAQIFADR
jgi:hypothetical protein